MPGAINRIGKYELKAVLARTALSTVYDGWDSDIARRVAIKLMPLSAIDHSEAGEAFIRFKRGAQAAGQLNHPNIVAVYDYGESQDYAYLVMEFVNGPTLKTMFDDNHVFTLSETCKIVGSVLDAIQYSHDRGVVHRDIKPANIMFTTENQVKITDFGIARLEDSELTHAGTVLGTPAYMSPEQFLGEKIDLRTDIYSTGVVLYHILTGERPYEGNLATIMHKVLYGSPPRPSRVSTSVTPALDAIVARAMARNREDRFQSAAEFNAALQATRKPAPPPLSKSSASPSRTLGFVALATCVLIAGGAIAWYGLLAPSTAPYIDPADQSLKDAQLRAQQEQQARLQQEQDARRQQEQQARLQQEQDARRQQEQQARLQQEQDARRQQEQQARLQQEQDARRQQEQQARLQQEQDARRQQEQQARLQQEQDARRQQEQQARLQQEQQARLQQEQQARERRESEARQRRAEDQARQKLAAEQARQTRSQNQASQNLALTQPRPNQVQEQPQKKQERNNPSESPTLLPPLPVTSSSGAAGLLCESLTTETAAKYGLSNAQGMVVKGVVAGGPAYKAGIRERDVILKINGSEARDISVLSKIAANNPPGQAVSMDVLHEGSQRVVQMPVN